MTLLGIILALIALLLPGPSHGGIVVLVDSFPSPLPTPRFGLAFDTTTNTLWGISNSTPPSGPVANFTLDGTLLSSFTTSPAHNTTGVAVNEVPGPEHRVYYWQNLPQRLTEARPDGEIVGTTIVGQTSPFTTFTNVAMMAFDSVSGRIVFPHRGISGVVAPGFHFVLPGVGIESTVILDIENVTQIAPILGFAITRDDYWLLGPKIGSQEDILVRINRATLEVIDIFSLLDSTGQSYRGLAVDPATGLLYTNFTSEGVRVFRAETLGWPFIESTGWRITGFGTGDCKGVNGKTEGDHCGDDWYAQDWNWGSGNDDLGKVLLSATTGKVIFSGRWDGYGNEVIIQLNQPFEDFALRYTHLEDVWVTDGDEVCLGSAVGVVGFTGLSGRGENTSHLHAVLYQKINEISARRKRGETGLLWLERGQPVESIRSGAMPTKFAAPLAFSPTMTGSGCGEAFVLAGRVTTSENQAVPNVRLTLSGPISIETIPFVKRIGRQIGGGNYAFRGLPNGTYTVTPERRGYIFDPPSRTVTIAEGHMSGVDFVAIPLRPR